MRIISLYQPWASLVAMGAKTFETRSWYTPYRGLVLIHAGLKITPEAAELVTRWPWDMALKRHGVTTMRDLPLGAIVGVATLRNVRSTTDTLKIMTDMIDRDQEFMLGDYAPGRFAWELTGIIDVHPIPLRGQQGLWTASAELRTQVKDQLKARGIVPLTGWGGW